MTRRLSLAAGLLMIACTGEPQHEDATLVVPDTDLVGVANSSMNLFAISAWARSQGMPTFADYGVPTTFDGTPAPPNLGSAAGARRYRTTLRNGAAEGPNFGGRFTVVEWGCGSPCVTLAIVDAESGRVYMHAGQFVRRPMYRLDSRLLIEDPTGFMMDSLGHPYYASLVRYFEWTGDTLVQVDSLDAAGMRIVGVR